MSKKHDLMNMEPFSGPISKVWEASPAYAVIFADGSKGTVRSRKTPEQLFASGRITYIRPVLTEPLQ